MDCINIIYSLIAITNIYWIIKFYHFPIETFECYIENNSFTRNISCLSSCNYQIANCTDRIYMFNTETTYDDIEYSLPHIVILAYSSIILIYICLTKN